MGDINSWSEAFYGSETVPIGSECYVEQCNNVEGNDAKICVCVGYISRKGSTGCSYVKRSQTLIALCNECYVPGYCCKPIKALPLFRLHHTFEQLVEERLK